MTSRLALPMLNFKGTQRTTAAAPLLPPPSAAAAATPLPTRTPAAVVPRASVLSLPTPRAPVSVSPAIGNTLPMISSTAAAAAARLPTTPTPRVVAGKSTPPAPTPPPSSSSSIVKMDEEDFEEIQGLDEKKERAMLQKTASSLSKATSIAQSALAATSTSSATEAAEYGEWKRHLGVLQECHRTFETQLQALATVQEKLIQDKQTHAQKLYVMREKSLADQQEYLRRLEEHRQVEITTFGKHADFLVTFVTEAAPLLDAIIQMKQQVVLNASTVVSLPLPEELGELLPPTTPLPPSFPEETDPEEPLREHESEPEPDHTPRKKRKQATPSTTPIPRSGRRIAEIPEEEAEEQNGAMTQAGGDPEEIRPEEEPEPTGFY